MKISDEQIEPTSAKYCILAEAKDLDEYKSKAINELKDQVKVPGFRPGKAPDDMVTKYLDPNELSNRFLNIAISDLYEQSLKALKLRVVGEPKINISKFVAFSILELTVEVPIIKDVKLADYLNFKLTKNVPIVSAKMVEDNLRDIQKRFASLTKVNRAAKKDDLVVIDFEATDFKTKQTLPSASAKGYQLVIGEARLIKGFEDKLIGLKAGQTSEFNLTFPGDYYDKAFAARRVTFKVTLNEISEVNLPKLDDKLAASFGPFKTLTELKGEIKKQLRLEAERQATIDLENRLLDKLAEGTKAELNNQLIDSELSVLEAEAKRTALDRGQTWDEFLKSLGYSEDEYMAELKKTAEKRIKGGLAIGEIAQKQQLLVTDSELNLRIAELKKRYSDEQMKAELDKPDNRRELAMRLLTEKVLDYIAKNQNK